MLIVPGNEKVKNTIIAYVIITFMKYLNLILKYELRFQYHRNEQFSSIY